MSKPESKKKVTGKSSPGMTVLKGLGYALYLGVFGVAGTAFGWVSTSKVGIQLMQEILHPRPPEEVFKGDANLTLLILGCDQDTDEKTKRVLRKQARSDMMLVANLDFRNHRITGLSIPRDTACDLPGYEGHRINAFHSIAKVGEEASLTKKAVEFLLPGVSIDRVLTLDYEEFEKMVDMIGGVSLNVERNMDYDDNSGKLHIHLKQGLAKLNGRDAIGYVRYRHGDDDFRRQERQKHFLVAFKDQLIRNWTQLGKVADQGRHAIGDTLTPEEIASIALFSKTVRSDQIKMGMLPVTVQSGNGPVEVDEDRMKTALKEFNLVQTVSSKDPNHE